jgi:hypothetical protein
MNFDNHIDSDHDFLLLGKLQPLRIPSFFQKFLITLPFKACYLETVRIN